MPATKIYFTAVNSARPAVQRLEDHLRSVDRDTGGVREFLEGLRRRADDAG